jgi:predicted glycosyltransferase
LEIVLNDEFVKPDSMNILFDLNHPVDMNCLKPAINILANRGFSIVITYRPRGNLKIILESEMSEYPLCQIGKHYSNLGMKILGQLKRDWEFVRFYKRNEVDLSVGSSTNVIASWLMGIPHLALEDDYEYKIPFYHANIFAKRHIMPDHIKVQGRNIYHYRGIKEIAYLNPKYFTPNKNVLNEYGLKPQEYVFIRKIANVSLNYKKEDNLSLDIIDHIKDKGLKILLSLEDKQLKNTFEKDCIILQEPVRDIYSLMKYAMFTISSGDSMARESSLLAVPTIYTGGRQMVVNEELIEMGCMFKEDKKEQIEARIDGLATQNISAELEEKVIHKMENEWDDPTEVLLKHINDFLK